MPRRRFQVSLDESRCCCCCCCGFMWAGLEVKDCGKEGCEEWCSSIYISHKTVVSSNFTILLCLFFPFLFVPNTQKTQMSDLGWKYSVQTLTFCYVTHLDGWRQSQWNNLNTWAENVLTFSCSDFKTGAELKPKTNEAGVSCNVRTVIRGILVFLWPRGTVKVRSSSHSISLTLHIVNIVPCW